MNIIYTYYSCILTFTNFTGFKLTNEDSRAALIFTVIVSFNLATLLTVIGVDVQGINRWVIVIYLVAAFFSIYAFFSTGHRKNKLLEGFSEMSDKEKFTAGVLSLVYTVLSTILFFKII